MATTREQIVTLRTNNPNLPAVQIAEFLSISRERVRQIQEKALEKLQKEVSNIS